MCHATYDYAWMKCPSIFWILLFSFLSFLVLTNAKCKCHMQMPWLVLPMRYSTIVPQYAIDRLLTTDLDVNFLWMQTKCNASLDFSFLMQLLFDKDVDAKCPYDAHVSFQRCNFHDADVPCKGANAKFIHCDANVSLQRWRCKNLVVQMPFNGYVMMQMLLVGMSWCKCPFGACHDANVRLEVCLWCECPLVGMHDANVPLVHAMIRMFPCGYVMMQMSMWVYNDANALLWAYNDANASL